MFVLKSVILFNYLYILSQFNIKSAVAVVDVWPHPQNATTGNKYLVIDSTKFEFIAKTSEKCELLTNAIDRTKDLAFIQDCSRTIANRQHDNNKVYLDNSIQLAIDDNPNNAGQLDSITVTVKDCKEQLPHLDMNENYTLVVTANTKQAQIQSDTVWGALRALETFSQLVVNTGSNQFTINETNITDSPRFRYRGLMIDTSRHFIPVRVLLENLDAMSYNKLNVFHWHIVDEQAFPYVSKKFPHLSLDGSYNPVTHVYTGDDIKRVIEYGRQRGIRVVVEFDTPGHTLSWGKSQKTLLTECYTNGTRNGKYGPIDPSKDSAYQFLEQLFGEVTETFVDQYFHLGGDEVNFDCWKSNPDITKFMEEKQIKTYAKLEDYYMKKVLNIVEKYNKSYIIWEEVFNNGVELKSDTVVHVWIGSWGDEHEKYWRPELHNVTSKGFRAILSSCWYLDLISFGPDWETYYTCEPHSFNGTDAQKSLVIGGEAAVWTEYINGANLISRTWPRAMAAAERLWSPRSFSDYKQAVKRFNKQNCLMIKRGLRTEPQTGPGYCQCDYELLEYLMI